MEEKITFLMSNGDPALMLGVNCDPQPVILMSIFSPPSIPVLFPEGPSPEMEGRFPSLIFSSSTSVLSPVSSRCWSF
ncbi:hypothetical protein CEXT_730011 [Caerostris extrusa]|uniref:Uncharacterized protein n=1 Tax=Caerostris extrusa TaxID=172846 RepID=A0AAV4PAV7_CAEEX|nr:hypothetical protein CEXT_730011 [Caerostris extrusa]